MKDRIVEIILIAVTLFLLVTSVFFWYDRAIEKYVKENEKWRVDVTSIINHNFQTGRIEKPGTPPVPPRK